MTVVGVDCATVAERTGTAVADFSDGKLVVLDCWIGKKGDSTASQIAQALRAASTALIALDSPLGWPAALGRHLVEHEAGRPIAADADALFRRRTDKAVQDHVGKAPLEVGADRIARTARVALLLLDELATQLGRPIPLAWNPKIDRGFEAIEVYPAGTLRAYQALGFVEASGSTMERKRRLLESLAQPGQLAMRPALREEMSNEHLLDAVLCLAAARDFLLGTAIHPSSDELEPARKEGWIWVRDPR